MESDGGGRRSNAHDTLVSALSADGGIVVRAVSARNLVQDALIRLQLSPVPAQALGEVAVCNLLLASGLKDREQLQLTIAGNGPISGITSIADGHGDVKAMLQGDRKFTGQQDASGSREKSIRRGIGRGQIQLVRSHPDWIQPFQSITEIRNVSIPINVAFALLETEQRTSAIDAGVEVSGALVQAAAGYYVERLPDASEETLQRVEENLKGLKNDSLSTLFRSGLTAPDLVDRILEGVGVMHGTYSTGAPSYKCSCSPERFLYRLKALPRPELEQIILKQEILEMTCAFCGEVYHISWDRVRKLLDISEQENELWREEAPPLANGTISPRPSPSSEASSAIASSLRLASLNREREEQGRLGGGGDGADDTA
ncbi:unnamed protein product [Vitrella brassicaformis CCMP3155]|uniref:Uncharacterized protein n=1 Tax=Vitrella brassicaformis (strain CCMP3155) TaxID=1169540 RepID=A0A0G4ETJ1_VITBC|nr:unnamed protein product [Vitrella brassicaformis CCMP3155]|eukprot:CEM01924.1 unnamed protein product [Vitrella brassicaformis CCMP3155]